MLTILLIRLRHKPDGAQQMRRFSAETANPSVSQMPPNCWVSEICDAVVLGLPLKQVAEQRAGQTGSGASRILNPVLFHNIIAFAFSARGFCAIRSSAF